MALQLDYETPQGVDATYHKLLKVEISAIDLMVRMTIAIYASAAARTAGKAPLWHEYVAIPFEDMAMDPRVPFYELANIHPESYLNGAQDI